MDNTTADKNYFKVWYERNKHREDLKAQRNEASKRYQSKNPEKFRAQQKKYAQENKELIALRRKRDRLFMRKGKGENVDVELEKLNQQIESYQK